MTIDIAFNSSAYSYTPFGRTTPYTFGETCERIARAGYEHVEIAAVRPHCHPADNSRERFESMRDALDSSGLTPAHLCSHQVVLGLNPSSPDAPEREATVDHLRGLAEACDALDVPTFHFHAGWTVGTQSLEDAWERGIATVNEAFDDARLETVRPLIEPLNRRDVDLVHTPEHALRFADSLDHDVGVLLDTVQMYRDGVSMWDMVHEASGHMDVIHLADTDRLPPGDGTIDFGLVFDALDDVGFDGVASVEIWGDDPDALARRAHETVRQFHEGQFQQSH